jgi:cell division protein FtsB
MRQVLEETRARAPAVILALLAAALLFSALTSEHGLAGILALQNEIAEAKQSNFRIVQRLARIREEIRSIRLDDDRLEQVSRRHAHLVRPGETLYWLPRPAGSASPGADSSR